ncbi:hypothetical protein FFZ99_17270 [Leptospira interrogans]|nr:hypothetical protein FF006_16925 [Leptospira interrogans]TQE61133.1 hypothetical protein FFZ99_17270 [Leptospira interrogans]TQE64078.1 hypothetical protein FF001_16860 [Leptospira interrogans]TQE69518.1 hypothetical protein FF002_16985 [Leptospira interrogans]
MLQNLEEFYAVILKKFLIKCSSSYIFVKLNASLLWLLCETQRLTPHGSFDRSHLAICECSSSFNLVQFL